MIKIVRTSNGAPVCPISRDQPVAGQPARIAPFIIPRAIDLESAIAAANQAGLLTMIFLGPGMVTNNIFPPYPIPVTPSRLNSPKQDGGGGIKFSRWREKKRQVKTYKLSNRNNSENWLKIERIVMIEWEDKSNGQKLKFEWGESPQIPTTEETLLSEKNLYE